MSKKHKIQLLHLITGLDAGGAEKVVLDLARSADTSRFDVFIAGVSDRTELVYAYHKVGLHPVIFNAKKKVVDIVRATYRLIKFIRENKIELVHCHMIHAWMLMMFAKPFVPGVKVVFTSHNIDVESKIRETFLLWTKKFRQKDIVFSKDMVKAFYRSDFVVIPNGIEASQYRMDMEKFDKFTFLCIGRLEPQKNQLALIELAEELEKRVTTDFQILIVGKGILKEEIQQKIDAHNQGHRVKLLGFRRDIIELCNQSHVFIMPSLWEGFPIALLEAGASSMPVLCTPVGSIPSLINDENGFLRELKDFPDTMEKIINNYALAEQKGKRLEQTIIDDFEVSAITAKHEALYESVMSS